jgi:16S rRNA C1402 (ribose-2'-O) methylase RsmI
MISMNARKEQALHIISPLTIGKTLGDGWILTSAEETGEPGGCIFIFNNAGEKHGTFEIVVRRKQSPQECYAQTDNYTVAYRSTQESQLDMSRRDLLDRFIHLIRRNEGDVGLNAVAPGPECHLSISADPTLYLVPGHVGNPLDIGKRAVMILARVPNIFVEKGLADQACLLLRLLRIGTSNKTIVELSTSPAKNGGVYARFRRMIRKGQHVCLFGVGEGVPGFVDPGSDLIDYAEKIGATIRTVGGPSSLSLALMRVGRRMDEFAFLGRLKNRHDAARMARQIHPENIRSYVLFSDGRSCRRFLAKVFDASRCLKGWLVANLTADDEIVVPFHSDLHRALSTSTFRDDGKAVVLFVLKRRNAHKGGTAHRGASQR